MSTGSSSSSTGFPALGWETLEGYGDRIVDIVQPTPQSEKIRTDIMAYLHTLLKTRIHDIKVMDGGIRDFIYLFGWLVLYISDD